MNPKPIRWYDRIDWSKVFGTVVIALLAGTGSSVSMDAYRDTSDAATIEVVLDRLDSLSVRVDRMRRTVESMDSVVRSIEDWRAVAQRRQDSTDMRNNILRELHR